MLEIVKLQLNNQQKEGNKTSSLRITYKINSIPSNIISQSFREMRIHLTICPNKNLQFSNLLLL